MSFGPTNDLPEKLMKQVDLIIRALIVQRTSNSDKKIKIMAIKIYYN